MSPVLDWLAGRAGPVVFRAPICCGGASNWCAAGDAIPELHRGPLVEEAHGQGHASPTLDRARRLIRAIEHALGVPIVLVLGEGSPMDRELRDRKSPAVFGRPQIRKEQLEQAGIAQLSRFL